ncbi:hypothetical protein [Scatolibacter rhodanostii]|uniref:hypothetical protein n=1 Tax=Scatolibacter rhodanostii TaxID=2014781 RepID=UPI000C0897C7|nr:hypothetical protein [Scatolibacter rhodanostii]
MNIKTYYCNSTKILKLLRRYDDYADNRVHRAIVGKNFGEKILTEFRISNNLSNFDCDVADAVYTIYKNHDTTFTPGQVLRVLSGDEKQTIVKGYNQQHIIDSIEWLRKTEIEIGCEAEMDKREIPLRYIERAPFLVAEKVSPAPRYAIRANSPDSNSSKKEEYADLFMPLYGYAERLHQFNSFPQQLLYDTTLSPEFRLSNTLENIQIKRFLIRRLEPLRNLAKQDTDEEIERVGYIDSENKYRLIVYERASKNAGGGIAGLLSDIGIYRSDFKSDDSWKHKRHSVHRSVTKILDYYKHIGYIQDYEVIKKGKIIYGVNILGKVKYPK